MQYKKRVIMKKYQVTFYYHTNITVEVEAENEEEALKEAEIEQCSDEYTDDLLNGLQEDDSPDVVEL